MSSSAPAEPLGRRIRDHLFAIAPAIVIGWAVHSTALRMFFAQDDVTFLSRAAGLAPTPWSMARPLSEALAWRVQFAAFGLDPAPYAIVRMTLHLACTVLVYASGLRLLRGRVAAGAAAVLFAASSVAFTPLHWGACIVELLAATLALLAFLLHLIARRSHRSPLPYAAAAVAAAAVLAKESTIVLPLAFSLTTSPRRDLRGTVTSLLPVSALLALLGTLFVVTRERFSYSQYTGGVAYSMNFSPAHLFLNLSTYLKWCVIFGQSIRDRAAGVDPTAWGYGVAVIVVGALLLWADRRDPRRATFVGAGWFIAFLLPVLPLANHSYQYYLYLPWAGVTWFLVAAYQRLSGTWPRARALAIGGALLVAFVGGEWRIVRDRETAKMGPLPADKTVREGLILRNLTRGLIASRLPAGARVGLLNPWPHEHFATDGKNLAGANGRSYLPLEATLRGGETMRLFAPGLQFAGIAEVPPPDWDGVALFLYDNDGTLLYLGRGPMSLVNYSRYLRGAGRLAEADSVVMRGMMRLASTR